MWKNRRTFIRLASSSGSTSGLDPAGIGMVWFQNYYASI